VLPVKKLWKKLGGSGLLASLVLHAVLIAVAGVWVITELIPQKETVFTSTNSGPDTAVQQVEHRIQLARRAGSSGGAQMSAQRITGATVSSFAMPEMPETSNVGMGAISGGGFGSGGFGLGSGSGAGFGSGTGGTAGSMRDVMSIFGAVRINSANDKVVFIIDVSDHMMTPQKGGFDAYAIVRAEMSKLITRLPLSVRFNAIVFDQGSINIFRRDGLLPANSANKEAFVAWFDPLNRDAGSRGDGLSGSNWRPGKPELVINDREAGMGDMMRHGTAITAVTAAFEMQPTQVYLFTGRIPWAHVRQRTREAYERDRARMGDTDPVRAAREVAFRKARQELDSLNARLVSQGKNPIIIPDIWTLEQAVNQRAFSQAGVPPVRFDRTGWEDGKKELIWPVLEHRDATPEEIIKRLRDVSKILGGDRPKLGVTMLVGPDDEQKRDQEGLGRIARAYQGRFNTIDFAALRRLREDERK
jgi:hypothetical protein